MHAPAAISIEEDSYEGPDVAHELHSSRLNSAEVYCCHASALQRRYAYAITIGYGAGSDDVNVCYGVTRQHATRPCTQEERCRYDRPPSVPPPSPVVARHIAVNVSALNKSTIRLSLV
jgi:hypothetical protein